MSAPEIRFGDWREVLSDVRRADALIFDAPYSEKTHAGHNSGTRSDESGIGYGHRRNTRAICYEHFTDRDVAEVVDAWHDRIDGWIVSITDHVLAPVWAAKLEAAGRYVFPPLPIVDVGMTVRLAGDGPSSWTCWAIVARPKTRAFHRWGALRGAYLYRGNSDLAARRTVMGGKRLDTMRDIVRDYTRPGDLVIDPFAGGGTTLLAAALEGRRAIGAEMMPEHYAIAEARLARGYTPPLFVEGAGRLAPEQVELTLAGEGGDGEGGEP